jgi:hypothetical protein
LGVDAVKDSLIDEVRVNPKLGITWQPFDGMIFRSAAFRATKRSLITDQTIEPTQVAGFNQFFDDPNSADVWRYGLGLDREWSSVRLGLEYVQRELEIPVKETSGLVRFSDKQELQGRAYLYWSISPRVVFTTDYLFSSSSQSVQTVLDGALLLRTHQLPVGIGYFHSSGLSFNARATYTHQTGEYVNTHYSPLQYSSGKEAVWLTDLELGYRLHRNAGVFAIGARNIFDRPFRLQDIDLDIPQFIPGRAIYGRLSMNF